MFSSCRLLIDIEDVVNNVKVFYSYSVSSMFRKFCGLPVAETFEELFGSMPNSTVYRYASIFE